MRPQVDQQPARLRRVDDVMPQQSEMREQREQLGRVVGLVETVELGGIAHVAGCGARDRLRGSGCRRDAFLEPRIGGADPLALGGG